MVDILSIIKTKDASATLVNCLEEYLSSQYVTGAKTIVLPDSVKSIIKNVADAKEIINILKNAEILEITLGFKNEDAFENTLYNWFISNGFKNFLLDIKFEKDLLGGCLLVYKGKYFDLSLVSKLHEPAYAKYTKI